MMKVFRPLTLGLALLLASAGSAFAQDAAPAGEEEGGSPVPGYITTGLAAALAIFILCKSARRS